MSKSFGERELDSVQRTLEIYFGLEPGFLSEDRCKPAQAFAPLDSSHPSDGLSLQVAKTRRDEVLCALSRMIASLRSRYV